MCLGLLKSDVLVEFQEACYMVGSSLRDDFSEIDLEEQGSRPAASELLQQNLVNEITVDPNL